MKARLRPIVALTLLLIPVSIFSQVERIDVGSIPSSGLVCRTDSNTKDRYKLFVPAEYQPSAASAREITEMEEMRNQVLFKVFAFSYSSERESITCKPTQFGFEITFSPKSVPTVSGSNPDVSTGSTLPTNPGAVLNSATNSNPPTKLNPVLDSRTSSTPPIGSTSSTADDASANAAASGAPNLSSTIATKNAEVREESADLSVPESPGFAILGLTPQTVLRPATPREFATAVINSLDEHGNFQSGVAIDTAPYLLFFGNNVTLGEYRGNFLTKDRQPVRKPMLGYLNRLFSRTQFSLATTKGTTESDKSAKIGAGLHVVLFDYGDPRLDTELDECFVRITNLIRERAKIDVPDYLSSGTAFTRYEAAVERLVEANRADYKVCIEESKERNFASSSLVVGGAGSWISPTGDSGKFTYNGAGFWSSLAYGFEGISAFDCAKKQEKARANDEVSDRCIKPQLIFHFRRRMQETIPDPLLAGMFTTRDSNYFGMRLRVGVPKWTANLEGVYQGEHLAGRAPDSSFKYSLGTDYKLADNLYLNFAIGGETRKSSVSDNKVFIRTSFNWGTSQKPLN